MQSRAGQSLHPDGTTRSRGDVRDGEGRLRIVDCEMASMFALVLVLPIAMFGAMLLMHAIEEWLDRPPTESPPPVTHLQLCEPLIEDGVLDRMPIGERIVV